MIVDTIYNETRENTYTNKYIKAMIRFDSNIIRYNVTYDERRFKDITRTDHKQNDIYIYIYMYAYIETYR